MKKTVQIVISILEKRKGLYQYLQQKNQKKCMCYYAEKIFRLLRDIFSSFGQVSIHFSMGQNKTTFSKHKNRFPAEDEGLS